MGWPHTLVALIAFMGNVCAYEFVSVQSQVKYSGVEVEICVYLMFADSREARTSAILSVFEGVRRHVWLDKASQCWPP